MPVSAALMLSPMWTTRRPDASEFWPETPGAVTVRRSLRRVPRRHRTIVAVAYDEDLADRIRELMSGERRVTEKKMFGGLAFLVGGNMAIAASGQGGLLVRVDPAKSDALVARTAATVAVMQGRPMAGWLRVATEDVKTKRQLAKWVERGTEYARSLPVKR
jgi:TfoX/Sxy family transcriptional regulator of competence genes